MNHNNNKKKSPSHKELEQNYLINKGLHVLHNEGHSEFHLLSCCSFNLIFSHFKRYIVSLIHLLIGGDRFEHKEIISYNKEGICSLAKVIGIHTAETQKGLYLYIADEWSLLREKFLLCCNGDVGP